MLEITIPGQEMWDESKEEFISTKGTTIQLEHSLISLSKWESKWHKPFLGKGEKTVEETLDYIRCMTLTQNVNPEVYSFITNDIVNQIIGYIEDSMTATWFAEDKIAEGGKSKEKRVVTSELIYCWMVTLNIPFECQKWHLNRLLTLIRVCNEENKPPEKKNKREIAKNHAAINAARRKAMKEKKG